MRHATAIALLALLPVSAAFAIVDPDPDSIGLYFDAYADVYEAEAPPYSLVPVHIIATNPTYAEIHGYEFGIEISGSYVVSDIQLYGENPFITGSSIPGDCIVGLGSPLIASEATYLGQFQVFLLDANPILFLIRGTDPSSNGDSRFPSVLIDQETILALGPSGWDDATRSPTWCAALNSDAVRPVETVPATFDHVKCLFR